MAYNMRDDIKEVYFTEEQLHEKVAELGARITEDYRDKNPLIVSVLKGSYVFMADLTRKIEVPCTIDFMSVSSYGKGTTSSGQVQITKDLSDDIEGKDIIVVEDILDSGVTLSHVCAHLREMGPASLKICTLLDKPSGRKVDLTPDYTCFTVPPAFVVGFGLDYEDYYRNLPFVGVLKPSVYQDQ